MNIQAYPYDIHHKIIDGLAEIRLFCRTVSGMRICLIERDFRPYFIVESTTLDSCREEIHNLKPASGSILSVTTIEKSHAGISTSLLKVTVDVPGNVLSIAKSIEHLPTVTKVYETDIPFERRYLTDKQLTPLCLLEAECEPIQKKMKVPSFALRSVTQVSEDALPQPRVLALDIETYFPKQATIDPHNQAILMVALHGNEVSKVITWKRFQTHDERIEFVDSEAELLERLFVTIEQYKPECITGYNSDTFDFPFIVARAQKYNIQTNIGLDHSAIDVNSRLRTTTSIIGIPHIDLYQFIRNVLGRSLQTDSFTLNAVANELIGVGKNTVDIHNLASSWDSNTNLDEYALYNLQDAIITHNLCLTLWPNIEEFTKLVGIMPFDVCRSRFSQLVESFIIKQTAHSNELIPNKPNFNETQNRSRDSIEGAFVHEPTPGLYRDICVMDFRSLYPTIITSHNISPGSLRCACCEDIGYTITAGGSHYWYCAKKKGFISKILEEVIMRRMRIKDLMKDVKDTTLLSARSEALKLLSNSFYGYLGFASARWYSYECSESITAFARDYIQNVMRKAKECGFEVLYGDTDSVFLGLGEKSINDAHTFRTSVNETLPGLMELEFESFCPSGIFVATKTMGHGAKKRYALLKEDGSIQIKGFESVRRNVSKIAREVQKHVLQLVLKQNSPEKARTYVKEIIDRLRKGGIGRSDVLIQTQLQKPITAYDSIGPHVAAAIRMKERGEEVSQGTIIQFYVGQGEGKIRDRVRLPEEDEAYDAEYYIHNQIVPAVGQILQVFGIHKDDLIQDRAQQTLGHFA